MSTKENLQDAFAGESQANRKYLAFAKQAQKDGYTEIAKLFKAVAEAETIHAHTHLNVLGQVKSTKENIAQAMAGEDYEVKTMYPKFIEEASAEGEKAALNSFKNAMAVEQVHFSLFNEAAQALEAGSDLPKRNNYVCSVCGNTIVDEAPDKCPVCGVGKDKFNLIEE